MVMEQETHPFPIALNGFFCSFKIRGRNGIDWVSKIIRAGQRAAKVSVKTLNLISANTDTFSDFALAA